MRILVLGGTGLVGRHIVAAALAAGHELTLVNRGGDLDVFPGAERRIGDRDGGLGVLEDGSWDAVVDVDGFVPRLVGDAARLLARRTARYAFVSSVSVSRASCASIHRVRSRAACASRRSGARCATPSSGIGRAPTWWSRPGSRPSASMRCSGQGTSGSLPSDACVAAPPALACARGTGGRP